MNAAVAVLRPVARRLTASPVSGMTSRWLATYYASSHEFIKVRTSLW